MTDGDFEAGLRAEVLRGLFDWTKLRGRQSMTPADVPLGGSLPVPPSIGLPRAGAMALGVLVLVTGPLWSRSLAAAPVEVRFTEGVGHGFLLLRTLEGELIASGDLLQFVRGGEVTSRMVFRFDDGSLLDETVVFTQDHVFTMQSYELVQRGPAFAEDTEISLQRDSGMYSVRTTSHEDGRVETFAGTLDLPPDVYNGMVLTVAKNLPKETGATVHMVAFTPEPLIIELEIGLAEDHNVLVGELVKTATHFVLTPRPGPWLEFFARLLGRMPAEYHAWILAEEAPAFVRFEGPLDPAGPVWRIELTSPRWPD